MLKIKNAGKQICTIMFLAFIFLSSQTKAQLSVSHALTPAQLVQNVLLGTGVSVSNITYTGSDSAYGSFNGTASNIGFSSGVILCTGNIDYAVGPNGNCCAGYSAGMPGDAQLTAICGQTTNDAAIIEFDFVPTSDTVKFRYVFGSEEYPEFVGSIFNDVFAFFISGPGIIGTPNIALIPNTTTSVSINNVNNGSQDCAFGGPVGPCVNCAYYVDNCNGTTVEYDGFTTPLIAKHVVIPCQTYHIKIAIADAVDGVFDSGVFLEAGSFTGGAVSVTNHTHQHNNVVDTMAVEGCTTGAFVFTLPQVQNTAYTIHFIVGGTATNGVDYPWIADSLVIPAGQLVDSIVIAPFYDGITEANETVILTIQNVTLCSTSNDSIMLWIKNVDAMTATISNDTVVCPNQSVPVTVTPTGGYGVYTYLWDNGLGTSNNVTISAAVSTTYTVTITDDCGNTLTKSIFIDVTSPQGISSTNNTVIESCGTATVTFTLNSIQNTPTIITYAVTGTATPGADYPALPGNITMPAGQTSISINITPIYDALAETNETIIITLTNTCIPSSTTITIVDEPTITANITGGAICQGESVWLNATASGGTGPLTYTWTGIQGDSTSIHVAPLSTQTYFISVNDSCHVQNGRDSFTVIVYPIPTALFTFNELFDFNMNFINLTVNGHTYFWTFGDGTSSNNNQPSFNHAYPDTAGLYRVTLVAFNDMGCPDTITANVIFKNQYSLFIPTAFHPGDVLNPTFGVYSNGISSMYLAIFDRWGELLFETEDISNQWDGTRNGDIMKQDVYIWQLKAILKSGEKITKQGAVTLIR
ncbi:MAG: choice-of-anchor L domain-containing protein [Bacteroidota bacterium]